MLSQAIYPLVLLGMGCAMAPLAEVPRSAMPTQEERWEAWARTIMVAWPSTDGCEVVGADTGALTRAVAELKPDSSALRTVRYLALQCDLVEVQTAFVQAVAKERWSFEGYRAACYAGESARDVRCVPLLAVAGLCFERVATEGTLDPRCAAFQSWIHDFDQVSVTTNASVSAPSSSTSTSTLNPAATAAASNSGK